MKLVKSLLLGSAAGLVAAAGAQAADLPTRKAAPVDYVRVCAIHGPGFFYIPGSDTCIRIGGRARFEYVYGNVVNKTSDPSSFYAQGRLSIDARTQTDWGLLRAYFRTELNRRTGAGYFGSGSAARGAYAFSFGGGIAGVASGFPSFAGQDTVGNRVQTGVAISAAFVQWGGLTAGRIQSFFDFYADNDTWFALTDSDVITQALAYTYTFGNGFSATLSIEDPKERQKYPIAGVGSVLAGAINPSAANAIYSITYPFAFSPMGAPNVQSLVYTQREGIPDVVGVLRVDQGWGSAQLSAAYHRINSSGSTVGNLNPANGGGFVFNPLVPTVSGGYGTVTGNAWAVQAGVKINLPMIAAGDYVYLQAAYSKGNLSYVNTGYPSSWTGTAYTAWGTTMASYDAVVGPAGNIRLTPAWSALISYEHYWTPTIRQGIFGGAEHLDYGGNIRTAAGFAAGAACPTCLGSVTFANGSVYNPYSNQYVGGTTYNVGTNVIWSPVKDLDIGVEVFYYRNQMAHSVYDTNTGVGKIVKEGDAWVSRLRVQRDF